MTKWTPQTIIHVDREGDRDRASDRYSRYGSYVGARELSFQDHFSGEELTPIDPMAFALVAWEIATPPIMSPGLAEWRPDIQSIRLEYTEDQDDICAVVQIPLRHNALAAKIPYTYDDWHRSPVWTNNDGYTYLEAPAVRPGRPAVTATVTIRHICRWNLVTPGTPTGRPLVDDALMSVERTATTLNNELPEIIRNVLGEPR